MAEDFAIGKELEIPKSVLDNIEKIDKKINDISKDSELMAQKFGSAMTKMTLSSDGLLKKLAEMQTKINSMDISKFAQGVSNVGKGTTQIEQFSNAISKAAAAINKYNNSQTKQKSITNDKEIERLNKEIEALKKKTEQLEKYRKKQKQVAEEQSSSRVNTKAIDAYNRAMASSEALVTQRINKIAKLRQAEEMLVKTGKEYSANIAKIRSEIERLNKLNEGQVDSYGRIIKSHQSLMNTSDQLMRKLALIFSVSQIQGYLMNLVKVRGEFELQNTALASILQNKDQADKLFAQITELAVKSPFTLKELTTYTKSLSAYQVEYEKLYDTTKMLADVSAGLGVDMQRLILAFGQVKAANVLRGTEVRQFTEAGLNILGELAKYYSELEGRMITVGEVQDRVTKKMVSFGDVEEVFKRVTSAGGIFYNMQERQAETLAGQMSNLQDSIDIMLNDIGKANDGIIKNIVGSVKTVVENWEIFANLINAASVGFVVYTAKALLTAKANGVFSASVVASNVQITGLTKVLVNLRSAFISLTNFAKSNPLVLITAAAASAYFAISDQITKVEEARKEYDRLSNSILNSKKELDSLVTKISKNNSELSQYKESISNLSKGSEEYNRNQENLNKAQDDQIKLLNELKTKFPDVYDGLVKQKDGTVDLTEAQKKYNDELEKTRALNILMQQGVGFFDDDIKKDFSQLNQSYEENKKATEGVAAAISAIDIEATKAANSANKLDQGYGKAVLNILSNSSKAEDKLKDITTLLSGAAVSGGKGRLLYSLASDAMLELSDTSKKLSEDTKEANKELQKIIDNVLASAKVKTEEQFKALDENAKKSAVSFAKPFIDEIDVIKNEFIQKFVNETFQAKLGVTFDFGGAKDVSLSYLEKSIQEYIGKNNLSLLPDPDGKGASNYFDKLQSKYKDLTKEVKTLNRATEQREENITNEEKIKLLENEKKQIVQLLKAYGEYEESSKKGGNTALQRLKDQIALIKKAGDEYKKLRKYYSETDATKQIQDSFRDAFSNLSLDVAMSFDTEGIIKGIENLQHKTIQGGKEAVDEALAPLKNEQEVKVKATGIEEIQKQVESIFSNYEFNLELQSAGIDSSAFRNMLQDLGATDQEISMVGLDAATFEEAADKIRNIISDLQKEGGEAQLEQARKFQEQLTALEVKEARKRFDELAKLREKYQTNQEKMQTVQTSLFADKDALALLEEQKAMGNEVNKEQEELLKLRIQAGEDALLQLRSEALQLTDFWQKLFSDLNDISVSSLLDLSRITDEIIANRSEIKGDKGELKGYSSSYTDKNGMKKEVTLTKQQYQQLLKQNNQVADEIQKKNPFRALYEAMLKGKKEGETQLDYYTRLESILGDVSNAAFGAAEDLMDIFNANDEAKEMLNNIKGIADGAINLGLGAAKIASGDFIGGGLSAISGIASIVTSIGKIHDNKREKEIQRQIDLIEDLQRSYEKLQESIEGAYSVNTYKASYEQSIKNLEAQNEALRSAIAAEQDKKKTDDDRIEEWQNQIQDNLDAIKELQEEFIADLGGFGSDVNVKSAAQEFADAWLEAYMETGDGLDALSDKWDEYIQNVVAKQLMLKGTEKYLKPVMDMLDGMLEDSVFTPTEAKDIQDKIDEVIPQLNEFWKAIAGSFDLGAASEGDTMSGLSKSISSITEDQADALASITESIRFFAADSNAVLKQIYNAIAMPNVENPFLMELKQQTSLLSSINSLFGSVIKTSAGKGKVLRMEIA